MHPLLAAANLIDRHIQTLNLKSSTCQCCDAVRYENFQDYNDAIQLSAMVNRLRAKANPNRRKNGSQE